MKWTVLLLIALIATTLGVMFTEGAVKNVIQIAFFCTLGLGVLVFATGAA